LHLQGELANGGGQFAEAKDYLDTQLFYLEMDEAAHMNQFPLKTSVEPLQHEPLLANLHRAHAKRKTPLGAK
jgi:hypothetical protein